MLDYLNPESQRRFEQVQQLLADLGIGYNINARLVRGLDYYTHTVFEIQSDDLGAQATVCAGGRYDGLVTELGGPDTPAVGWASGLERLILLLQQLQPVPPARLDFYLVSKGDRAEAQSLRLAQILRQNGFSVELDLSGSAFGKQFKRADRSGAVACLILGDAEADTQTVQLKWLASGQQQSIAQTDLLVLSEQLRQQLAEARTATKSG
jgi:histidyl-tRNA synthetase